MFYTIDIIKVKVAGVGSNGYIVACYCFCNCSIIHFRAQTGQYQQVCLEGGEW